MIKTCEWCKKEFEAKTNKSKVCSSSCYNKRFYANNKDEQKARTKAWAEAHPEKVAATVKAWQEAHPEKVRSNLKKMVRQ